MGDFLVLYDTDRVKDYVFRTNKLKEIRGASKILDTLNSKKVPGVVNKFGGEVIYSGGGNGKFIFTDRVKAEECCTKLDQLYTKYAPTSSITCVISDFDPKDQWSSLIKAEYALRSKKDNKNRTIPSDQIPFIKYCELCGLYPAGHYRSNVQHTQLVCTSCYKMYHSGRKSNKVYNDLIKKYAPLQGDNFIAPEDLSVIGNACNSRGYVGMLYADANGLGKILQQIGEKENWSINELSDFSLAVENSVNRAITNAIHKFFPVPMVLDGKNVLPAEFIISGGDDLCVVLPANMVIDVTIEFIESFKRFFSSAIPGHQLTMSCGVLISRESFPINLMFRQAQQLLKSAKVKSRIKENQIIKYEDTLDFAVLSASNASDLSKLRNHQLVDKNRNLRITNKPYFINDIKSIISEIRLLKNGNDPFPHNKVKKLSNALFGGVLAAKIEILNLTLRLPDSLKQHFITNINKNNEYPWEYNTSTGFYATHIADMVELYNFIE